MYFVSYTTNKLAGPKIGWNVWEVKPAAKSYSVGPSSFKILKAIIGGSKRPDAKNVSVVDIDRHIVENKREVFERIFNL
ncbi:MAG: hypothetical protein ACOC1O_04255 [bacterium]